MTVYYLDSSAAVKLYIPETGSEWMATLLAESSEDRFVSVELLTVEVACALARAQRIGRISKDRCENTLALFAADSKDFYETLAVSRDVLSQATLLVQRRPLRAYDAVHLATALDITTRAGKMGLPAPVFVSADETLLAAARAEGLRAENPNDHP